MSEQKMYGQIRLITLILCGVGMLVAGLIFRQDALDYVFGILIGSLMGIISLNLIIGMTNKINEYNAIKVAMANYVLRYFAIGLVFFVAVVRGVNVFALLLGFLNSKLAIQIYAQLERRGFYGSN